MGSSAQSQSITHAHVSALSDSGVMTGSLIDQAQRIIGTLSMPDNITGKDV